MPQTATRHVIVHYHLFKNAGTSIDRILKQNFGDAWRTLESDSEGRLTPAQVANFLSSNEDVIALSSHTASLPPPELPGVNIYPVLFIRHPLDRVRSIYDFERIQQVDTEGARMAKVKALPEFVRWRLSRPGDRSIRDFQVFRLAAAIPPIEGKSERDRALEALECLPFVGVVERFDECLSQLQTWLAPIFPEIRFPPTRANITQAPGSTLKGRLNALREELGGKLYRQLVAANAADLALHEAASNAQLT